MEDTPGPRNRLDAAIDRLEEAVKSRIEQPMRRLRQAIAWRREQGAFNEDLVADEIEKIAFRDRQLQMNKPFAVEQEIDLLASRIMKEKP